MTKTNTGNLHSRQFDDKNTFKNQKILTSILSNLRLRRKVNERDKDKGIGIGFFKKVGNPVMS